MAKLDDPRSKHELLEEIRRLRAGASQELTEMLAELQANQEELTVQQAMLLESQHSLEETRDRYAELFDFSPVAYAIVDPFGVIEQLNLCAARLLGTDRLRLIGRPLVTVVEAGDRRRFLDHMARCRRGEARVETELAIQPITGPAISVQLVSAPAHSAEGVVTRFHTALIDLSEAKRAESDRLRAREEQQRVLHEEALLRAASTAKDRFLAVLSHELRTPLTPILLAIDTLERGSLPAELRSAAAMIRRNVLLEKRLIDDLLDMTRIVQGKLSLFPENLDLHALIAEVVGFCRAEQQRLGLRLSADLEAGAHYVRADPVRLRQVLWNMLSNALRNTPRGGSIRVRTTNSRPGTVEVAIVDTGRGIGPELLPRIFNVFEQAEETRARGVGLGIGLSICKGIVEAHGGRITAESEGMDRGATFTIELPVAAEPAASLTEPPLSPAARVPSPHERTILLVEDNDDSATALAELLRLNGYRVIVAGSMHDALAAIERADILISDIGLPDGSGLELMRAVCATRPMPAIALSGYGTVDDLRRSAEAGFERHMVKPVEPENLLKALQSLTAT